MRYAYDGEMMCQLIVNDPCNDSVLSLSVDQQTIMLHDVKLSGNCEHHRVKFVDRYDERGMDVMMR